MVVLKKAIKKCSSCETKYKITWNEDEQDLDPWTCPFCGFEVEHEEDLQALHDDITEFITDIKKSLV